MPLPSAISRHGRHGCTRVVVALAVGTLLSFSGLRPVSQHKAWNLFPFGFRGHNPRKEQQDQRLKETLNANDALTKALEAKDDLINDLENHVMKELEESKREMKADMKSEMKAEMKCLKSQSEFIVSREAKLIQERDKRYITIFWSVKQASPSLGDESARKIACTIDDFEDFHHEDRLRAEVKGSELRIFHGSHDDPWRLRLTTFGQLPQNEQQSLKHAVEAQILEQKRYFPMRKLVKEAFSKHLDDFVPETEQELAQRFTVELAPEEALKEIDNLELAFFKRAAKVFDELEEQCVDVEGVLADSWRPLALIRPLSVLSALGAFRAQLTGEPMKGRSSIIQTAVQVYHAFKEAEKDASERLAKMAAASLPRQDGDPAMT